MAVWETDTVGSAAYRVLFEHSSEGVFFWTLDGRITAANPAAAAMLDMGAEEICRLGHDGLIDQEDPRWDLAVAERERTAGGRRRPAAPGRRALRRHRGDRAAVPGRGRLPPDLLHPARPDRAPRRGARAPGPERPPAPAGAGDELTGFQNRRGLVATGTQLLQYADRQQAPVQVLFVDVGNVQELNERIGHHAGDAALQAVARALAVTFRKRDVLARIGGAQFLALSLHLAGRDCGAVTDRIRMHLGVPETIAFVGAVPEVSCGWTTRQAGDRSSLEELMARSDWAMLQAREARQAAAAPFVAADG